MSIEADQVIALYTRHAPAWVAAREQGAFVEGEWLRRFGVVMGVNETAADGRAVLDLGCGAGQPMAAHLVAQGYAVTGVDASSTMLELFRARLPLQRAVQADMRTLALGRRFAGILAWDSFFHLRQDDQRRMFAIFRAHAAPRAALMFTSGPVHGVAMGELQGEALYHASLAPDEYTQLLDAHGFDVIAMSVEDPDCGNRTIWLAQSR
ncbi:methyltransferase domain-containing protein [Duganella sp. FT80W]|uniref:Methyltransferase domain-containing protein n=1 Tax=Duganella guangzhouensis TaxID=2666084 RepID=A0A6I2LEP5_9BURK|nr:class I SAM-dependent methyltransferase [Duganella guangzhouensis]MRW94739.1 methyltransferase domain-containing protein [Duganella guangzhouensis]